MQHTEDQAPTLPVTNLTNVQNIAHLVGLSKFTLYKLAKKNEIPHYRCGKAIRFDINEVKAWMKQEAGGA